MSIKHAFFMKNVPGWERVLRLVLSIGTVGYALGFLTAPWSWVVAASAIGIAATGVFGFCPMCAMVGRRLDKV